MSSLKVLPMKTPNQDRLLVECDCGGHFGAGVIVVSAWVHDELYEGVEVTLSGAPLTWWERIRGAWRWLHGVPEGGEWLYLEDPEKVREIGQFFIRIAARWKKPLEPKQSDEVTK